MGTQLVLSFAKRYFFNLSNALNPKHNSQTIRILSPYRNISLFSLVFILKHDKVTYVECQQDDLLTFTTEWLYPHTPSFDEIITRLEKQKNNLTDFMDWLCDSIFGNSQIIDFKSKPKLFSAGRCTQDIKSSIIIPRTIQQ